MASELPKNHHLHESGQAEVVDEACTMERKYEFFVTTEEPHQPKGTDRGRIRRIVMKNFFETKRSDWSNNASDHNSKETVQKMTKLKSRFRLPKPGQEAAETTPRPNARSTAKRKESEKKEAVAKHPRVSSDDSQKRERSSTLSQTAISRESEGATPGKSKKTFKLILRANPDAHRFDPFDVLPVPGTPELNILVKLYKCGCRVNSIAINARNSWWYFISNDAGLLHATLATWALYGMLARRMGDLRVEKLRHKSEAIKEINAKIGEGQISDELVGTVAILANFENLLGAYDAAQLHIAALKRMVNARGGLLAFGPNDGLIRGILVDIHTATAFRTPPSFPRIPVDIDTPPLPDELLEEAAYSSPTSLLHLPLAAIDCFNIFYRLHRLALAISSRWMRSVSRLTISNLLYETEYMILSIPDYSRDFIEFDHESKDDQDEHYMERAALADAASIIEALLAATQIFIYVALREVPTTASLFSILLERLRVALDRPNVATTSIWAKVNNSRILLWALVVASSVASRENGREWWVAKLYEVVREIGIRSFGELQRALEGVAWTNMFFGDVLGGIWRALIQFARSKQGDGGGLKDDAGGFMC